MTKRVPSVAVVAVALVTLVPPSPARAWDGEAHRAILEIAMLLSPAAAARIPVEYREELLKEMQYPDSRDTLCRYHRGPSARVDPFAEAERELAFLTQGGPALRPYPRAKSIGRYLHWVADSVVPAPIAAGKVCEVLDFWANKDFVVFRERSPLAGPLSAALRARSEAAAWPEDGPSALPHVLRLAVNTTIEALLLLPAAPGAPVASDEGPVLFIVNRIDTGLSGMRSNLYYYEVSQHVGGGVYLDEAGIAEIRTGGQGEKKADLMQRERVQIAEQSSRKNPDGSVSIRALLFNNLKVPACDAAVQSGRWSFAIRGTLPPGGLRLASFDVPPGVDLRNLKLTSSTAGCPALVGDGVVGTDRRVVLGNTGVVPRFQAEANSTDLGGPSARRSSIARGGQVLADTAATTRRGDEAPGGAGTVSVAVGRPADFGLAAPVEVLSMEVVPGPFEWRVKVTVRNTREAPPGQVRLVVARAAGPSSPDGETESIWVDLRKLAAGATQTVTSTHRPRKGAVPAGLRLVDIRASS
jgi:hypothetical protein